MRKLVVKTLAPPPDSPTQPLTSPLSFDTVEKAVEGIINYDYQDDPDVYRDSQKAMYDKFNETGYLFKPVLNEDVTAIEGRAVNLFPYAKYEDIGVNYAVNYKGNTFILFFYRYDDSLIDNATTITDYTAMRLNLSFDNVTTINDRMTAIRKTEVENQPALVYSYSAVDESYYSIVHTNASEENLVDFLNALDCEKVEIK